MGTQALFPTLLYSEPLVREARGGKRLRDQLIAEIEDIAELDEGGKAWSVKNYPNGFTSYASANQLNETSSTFAELAKEIDAHVRRFARALDYDLGGGKLRMSNCWVNVMPPNAHHALHLHPLSVISGTFYVSVPKGSSVIKFEDPRMGLFMATPPRKEKARTRNQNFVALNPAEGSVVLFESWLRHEVPMNTTAKPRISVSFNYAWE